MTYYLAQSDAVHLPLENQSVDLVFTSPPYCDARTYGINAQRTCAQWVEWMLAVVTEATRVCRGLVLVNCAGVTRNRVYQPAPEGLMWEWWKAGGNLWRPAYWNRIGIPGSGGKQWLRADVEYVLCFKRDREWLPWADNTANGHPPKWGPGGAMSNRTTTVRRINQWGHSYASGGVGGAIDNPTCGPARPSHVELKPYQTIWGNKGSAAGRRADGTPKTPHMRVTRGTSSTDEQLPNREMPFPVLANPGNVVRVIVGGGVMGHPLAHENEAPFPLDLAKWFIRSWCPPGGIVLDPFCGSGTTVDAAVQLGRVGIGFDIRQSQVDLARRRMESPWKPSKLRKRAKARTTETLFSEVGE